jgi:hypothetical protein
VLLASGYSDGLDDGGQNGFMMLAKPYSARALADALARCLAPKRREGA